MPNLERFKEAQAAPYDGYGAALSEIRAGRKTGHWIWYVFPQLAGLGHSSAAAFYAIRDRQTAETYLRDPMLANRLAEITAAVLSQLRAHVALPVLMGSHVDALKVVSSLTLFEQTASRMTGDAVPAGFLADAGEVLDVAESQGYPRCRFTQRALSRNLAEDQ